MNLLDLIPGGLVNFIAFVLLFIPIAEFFFRERKLNLIELGLAALTISVILVPLIAWLLNFVMPFSLPLILITFAIPLVISAYLILTKQVGLQPHHTQFSLASFAVLLLFLLAFFLRLQPLSAYFYEFDPYYYMQISEFLLTKGEVPLYDDLVYASTETIIHDGQAYQLRLVGHRNLPLPQYLTAVWYFLSFGPGHYDHFENSIIANIYPPLLGALIVFLAYLLFKDEYSRFLGVSAAFLMSFMPILFSKFFAGVAEQLPWGIFAATAAIVFLHFALKYNEDRKLYILALISIIGSMLGSKAGMIPVVILSAFVVIKAALDFIKGERSKTYYELPLIVAIPLSLLMALYGIYFNPSSSILNSMFRGEVLMLLFASLFCFFVYHLLDIGKTHLSTLKKRAYALCGIGLLAVIFLITPIGAPILSYSLGLAGIGQLSASNALIKTVAEESLHGDDISGRFGIAGVSLDISSLTKNFISKYGALEALPVVLVLLLFSLIYGLFYRNSGTILVIALLVFSISLIGLQKIKYMPHLGWVLGLAICAIIGEACFARKEKGVPYYIGFGAGAVILLLAAFAVISYVIGFFGFFLGSGGIPFYSLTNPIYYIVFGAVLAGFMYLLYGYYKNGRWDGVFGISAMLLFLPFALNNVEVLPYSLEHMSMNLLDHKSVSALCTKASNSALYAQNFYCNIIPQYWYDSMEWMRKNVDDGSYVLSWWDYGHWTNHFALKKTVTRNDHPFVILDLEVADKYVAKNESVMAAYMKSRNSTYVLFDIDLVGKWGALTYLSCVYNGETKAEDMPYESKCSADYQFERMWVPQKPAISQMCSIGNQYGVVGYSSFGMRMYCTQVINGQYMLIFDAQTGKQLSVVPLASGQARMQDAVYNEYIMIYTKEGIADAPGRGYKSNFYKAFFLGELDGYTQVYPADRGGFGVFPIRIYKRNE
ncbi:MAG: hypothetical protein N3G76_01535 [Candidatus Micrarchaeota archaeon]|nr:hypothetical protein [Candidatus Micrarchaeota archaeon]